MIAVIRTCAPIGGRGYRLEVGASKALPDETFYRFACASCGRHGVWHRDRAIAESVAQEHLAYHAYHEAVPS